MDAEADKSMSGQHLVLRLTQGQWRAPQGTGRSRSWHQGKNGHAAMHGVNAQTPTNGH